jgi:hypothetical protein
VKLALSPDGETLALVEPAGLFHLLDAATGKEKKQLYVPREEARNPDFGVPAWSPDGKLVAAAGQDLFAIWDAGTGRKVGGGDGYDAQGVQFSPDGTTLAIWRGKWGGLSLYPVAPRRPRETTPRVAGESTTLAFGPSGRLLVSANLEGGVCLYERPSGREIERFTGHRAGVGSLALSPDGKTLLSASEDGTAILWDLLWPESGEVPAGRLSRREVAAECAALAGEDAARAWQAARTLVREGRAAPALLPGRFRLVSPEDDRKAEGLVARLDADDYEERRRAARALASMGHAAAPALTRALGKKSSLEVYKRAERLLRPLPDRATPAERTLAVRSCEVLEQIGTPEARRALELLGKRGAFPDLRREACASLERLRQGTATSPRGAR